MIAQIFFKKAKVCSIIFLFQASKPLIEKRRRARINQSLAELKALVIDSKKDAQSQVIILPSTCLHVFDWISHLLIK